MILILESENGVVTYHQTDYIREEKELIFYGQMKRDGRDSVPKKRFGIRILSDTGETIKVVRPTFCQSSYLGESNPPNAGRATYYCGKPFGHDGDHQCGEKTW